MLSHRVNVRTSKFWRKSKEKRRNVFRKFTKGIQGFDLGQQKKSKLSHACVPLTHETKISVVFFDSNISIASVALSYSFFSLCQGRACQSKLMIGSWEPIKTTAKKLWFNSYIQYTLYSTMGVMQ